MDSCMNEDYNMEVVMKNIYTSCDPDNSNLVPVSKLIEFITPYMLEDLSALESLRCLLDPENSNVCVSSEKFYEGMNEWTKKITNASGEDNIDLNRTPSFSEAVDEKQLPYIQSTPRASFGRKILNCEGLLNLSNVSGYSLSTSTQTNENSTAGQEKTILEEEVKRLEHHLNKVSSEMILVKLQLTSTEEQNDILQADLDRCKTRLHSEQQVIEHLQNDKKYNEELREELSASKKHIEELNKKVLQFEKDNHHLLTLVKQTEQENAKLEAKCEELSRREQEAKKEIINITTDLNLKDQEVTTILKINDELKSKLKQQRDVIDQLANENELLEHKKNSLEKALQDNLTARRDSLVHQFKSCLADSSNLPDIGTIPIYSSSNKNLSFIDFNLDEKSSFQKSSITSPILHSVTVKKEPLLKTVLKNSTPKTTKTYILDDSFTFDSQNCLSPTLSTSLNSLKFIQSLPPMHFIERSNIVQDQSCEEECFFNLQDMDYKNPAQDSLHAEISQVQDKSNFPCSFSLLSFENNERLIEFEDAKNVSGIVEVYKDEINQLKIKNDSIESRLEAVSEENGKLSEQITEMKETLYVLDQDINNLLIEKNEVEANLKLLETERNNIEKEARELKQKVLELTHENNNLSEKEKSTNTSLELKSKIISDLEQNLLELKREFTSLQLENIAREKELSTKFNFEAIYKKNEIELNEKNEEIESLTETNNKLKDFVTKLTTSNQELELSLKQARLDLKESEDKIKHMMSLNENIELTATQVQVHLQRKNDMINELVELNKRFETNVAKLEEDLQNKIAEVTELQNQLKANIDINNIMWRDNKDLKIKLDDLTKENERLTDEIKTIREKHEEGYSKLLTNYNTEVEKNCKLCDQIYTFKTDLASALSKYNEEVSKNCKLYQQVSTLKLDIDAIRESQENYKAKINKKLCDYEELINSLEKKLQDVQIQNDNLKTALTAIEKKNTGKALVQDSKEGSKHRSFEKQKLAIDRVKENLEITKEQLQHEKSKRQLLEQSLKDKDDIEEKHTKILLDFEQIQCSRLLEKQELQNMITELSEKLKICKVNCADLENKLKDTTDTLSLKLSQTEQQNQHLLTDLRNKEFVMKNAYLEIETYKNLFKNADQKAQELSKNLSGYLFEFSNKEKEIQHLNSEIVERDNKILSLSSKIANLDIELSSILNELADKKNINMMLEKENKSLQEMLSKSDDHKEKELLDIEKKLHNSSRRLQCSEMELNLIEKKLSDSKKEYELISDIINNYGSIITNGRIELSRTSNLILNKWNDIVEREDIYRELMLLKEVEPSEKAGEICVLDKEIKIATLLLEFMATKASISMEGNTYGINSLLNTKNPNYYSQSDVKMVKKFTLRPSRLLVTRPVSPDSPSNDITDTVVELPQEINFNGSKEIYLNQSPDNHISHACPYISDDSFKTAQGEFSFTTENVDFTSFQETFPNISDTFLEKLGLHELSTKQKLTKEETEELFTTFAIQMAIDSTDVKERLQKQKDRCVQQHEKFISLIKDITHRLRDHKCIGAADPITPVFVLLEDLKFLLRDLTQSTEQFGILICENRMMKCWNLVTNYMAFLKQDLTTLQIDESTQNENDYQRETERINYKSKLIKDIDLKKGEINSSSSSSKEDTGKHKGRWDGCHAVAKNSIVLSLFVTFIILSVFISAHWQCRMTAHENQVCVLDDFIKKIQIGNPPY